MSSTRNSERRSRVHFGFREAARHGGPQPNIGNPECTRMPTHTRPPDPPSLPESPQCAPVLPESPRFSPMRTGSRPFSPDSPQCSPIDTSIQNCNYCNVNMLSIAGRSFALFSRFLQGSRMGVCGLSYLDVKKTTADLYQARATRANYS